MTHDFQKCGILTCVDPDEHVQPHFKLRTSKRCSISSLTLVEYSHDEQRLWSEAARMRRLIWAFAGRTYHIVGNLMHWPILGLNFGVLHSFQMRLAWKHTKKAKFYFKKTYPSKVYPISAFVLVTIIGNWPLSIIMKIMIYINFSISFLRLLHYIKIIWSNKVSSAIVNHNKNINLYDQIVDGEDVTFWWRFLKIVTILLKKRHIRFLLHVCF